MPRKFAFSTVGLLLSLFGSARASSASETPSTSSAEPAPLSIAAASGQDFSHAPTQMVTPADPYEAYWDPNDPPVCSPQRGRHRAVVVPATAEQVAGAPQSVVRTLQNTASNPASVAEHLHGKVVTVDPNGGLVRMTFLPGREPRVGQIVRITHAFLFGPDEIGKLRIVRVGRGIALGRPIGELPFCRPIPGDVVDYWTVAAQGEPQMVPSLAAASR
jgi:hypothetical protein